MRGRGIGLSAHEELRRGPGRYGPSCCTQTLGGGAGARRLQVLTAVPAVLVLTGVCPNVTCQHLLSAPDALTSGFYSGAAGTLERSAAALSGRPARTASPLSLSVPRLLATASPRARGLWRPSPLGAAVCLGRAGFLTCRDVRSLQRLYQVKAAPRPCGLGLH